MDDEHALDLARNVVKNLNRKKTETSGRILDNKAPIYNPEELYGIVGTNLMRPYDVREVVARMFDNSEFDEFKVILTTVRHNWTFL